MDTLKEFNDMQEQYDKLLREATDYSNIDPLKFLEVALHKQQLMEKALEMGPKLLEIKARLETEKLIAREKEANLKDVIKKNEELQYEQLKSIKEKEDKLIALKNNITQIMTLNPHDLEFELYLPISSIGGLSAHEIAKFEIKLRRKAATLENLKRKQADLVKNNEVEYTKYLSELDNLLKEKFDADSISELSKNIFEEDSDDEDRDLPGEEEFLDELNPTFLTKREKTKSGVVETTRPETLAEYVARLRSLGLKGNVKLLEKFHALNRRINDLEKTVINGHSEYMLELKKLKEKYYPAISEHKLQLSTLTNNLKDVRAHFLNLFTEEKNRRVLTDSEKQQTIDESKLQKLKNDFKELSTQVENYQKETSVLKNEIIEQKEVALKAKKENLRLKEEHKKREREYTSLQEEVSKFEDANLELESLRIEVEKSKNELTEKERSWAFTLNQKIIALEAKHDEDLTTLNRDVVSVLERQTKAAHIKLLEYKDEVRSLVVDAQMKKEAFEEYERTRAEDIRLSFIKGVRSTTKEVRTMECQTDLQMYEPIDVSVYDFQTKVILDQFAFKPVNMKLEINPDYYSRQFNQLGSIEKFIKDAMNCVEVSFKNSKLTKALLDYLQKVKLKREKEIKTGSNEKKERNESVAENLLNAATFLSNLSDEYYNMNAKKFFSYNISEWEPAFKNKFPETKFLYLKEKGLPYHESCLLFQLLCDLNTNTGSKSHLWYGNELNRIFNNSDIRTSKTLSQRIDRAQKTYVQWCNGDAMSGYANLKNNVETVDTFAYKSLLKTINNVSVSRSLMSNSTHVFFEESSQGY
jgi:hypothetical protein